MDNTTRILLTGATGYVGGRLASLLERRGGRLRCMVRRPEYLEGRVAQSTEVVAGDVLDKPSLDAALGACPRIRELALPRFFFGSFCFQISADP
jgi:nucleoside-diphosphate-sugar epimerase